MIDGNGGIALIHIRNYMRDGLTEGLDGTTLKVNQVPVLTVVSSTPGLSITELSLATGLDKSTITRIVQQLVDIGLVVREGNPRQSNSVYLTDMGQDAARMVIDLEMSLWNELFDVLDDDERATLDRISTKIRSKIVG